MGRDRCDNLKPVSTARRRTKNEHMKTLELANGEAVVADFSKCRFLNPVFYWDQSLFLPIMQQKESQ